jgi:hypothetical protein
LVLLTSLTTVSRVASAQSYEAAERQYRSGDLTTSESSLLVALRKPMSTSKQAQSLKLLGVIRYTKGNLSGAERNFKEALSLNPGLTITQQEVLDPKVIGLFEKVRKRVGVASKVRRPIQAGKQMMGTSLKIIANGGDGGSFAGGKVMIDGIYAGDTGYAVSVDPGNVSFEVTAQGYQSYRGMARVAAGRETVLNITLKKQVQPPLVVAAPVGRSQAPANQSSKGPRSALASKSQHNATYSKKPAQPSSSISYQPKKSEQQEDLFAETSSSFKEQRGYELNQPAPPVNDFDRDLEAAQRQDREAREAKKMQRIKSRPPVEEVYGVSPRNEVSQNPGVPQPGYFTPQSESSASSSNQKISMVPMAEPIPDPAYKKNLEAEGPTLITLFPFGLGQISQNRYGIGGVLFAIQGGLLFYAYDKNSQADIKESTLQRYVDLNCSFSASDRDDRYLRCLEFVDKEYKSIDGLRNDANYALIGLGVVALGGIIEAIYWEPPKKIYKKPSNRATPGQKRQIGYSEERSNYEDFLDFRWGLTQPFGKSNHLGLGIGLEYRF